MRTRKRAKRPSELECTAYHEAGHAVAGLVLGRPVKRVSIIPNPDDSTLGHCQNAKLPAWFDPEIDDGAKIRNWAEREIVILFAGVAAEAKFSGRRNHVGASHDYSAAAGLAMYFCGTSEETGKYLDWLNVRAKNLFNLPFHWQAVRDLAEELMQKQELTGRDARRVWRATAEKLLAAARAGRPGNRLV